MSAFSSKSDENCGKYSSGQTHTQTDAQTDAQTRLILRGKIFSPEMTEYKKSATNAKQYFFSKFYIDEIAMRKKRANLPMHTLLKMLKNPSFFPEHSSDVNV